MRIQYASDLHLDYGPCPLTLEHIQGDVLVLAGNLHERIPLLGENLAHLAWAGIPVLFVPGDREAMSLPWENSAKSLRSMIPEGPVILDREEIILFGVRFLGCTLWSDFSWNVSPKKGPEGAFLPELRDAMREERAWSSIASPSPSMTPRLSSPTLPPPPFPFPGIWSTRKRALSLSQLSNR